MAALAGVMSDGVGKVSYPAKGPQKRPAYHAPAGVAAGRVVAEGAELVYLAERTGEGMESGRGGTVHVVFPSH
jgi:hypothetical protein